MKPNLLVSTLWTILVSHVTVAVVVVAQERMANCVIAVRVEVQFFGCEVRMSMLFSVVATLLHT